jgi:hypothetical protein
VNPLGVVSVKLDELMSSNTGVGKLLPLFVLLLVFLFIEWWF